MAKTGFRKRINDLGVDKIYVLSLRQSGPSPFLRPVGSLGGPMFTYDESEAEVFATQRDAQQMQRTVEWLTGNRYDVIERPTMLDGPTASPFVDDFIHSVCEMLDGEDGDIVASHILTESSDDDLVALDPSYFAVRTEQGTINLERGSQ